MGVECLCRACKLSAVLLKARLTPSQLLTAAFHHEYSSFAVLSDFIDPTLGRAVHSVCIREGSLAADCLVGASSRKPRDREYFQPSQQRRFTWAQTVINCGARKGETRHPRSTDAYRNYATVHLSHWAVGSIALLPERPTLLALMVHMPHATISTDCGTTVRPTQRGAVDPTLSPVVSSRTPKERFKTRTHNCCGQQRQAASMTPRCEAQRFLASVGGVGTAVLSSSDIPIDTRPSTRRETLTDWPNHGPNAGHTPH